MQHSCEIGIFWRRQNLLLYHIASAKKKQKKSIYLFEISNVIPSADQSWATSIGVKKIVTKTSLNSQKL